MDRRVIARLGTVAIGIWLEAAPAVLSYGNPAADVGRVVGPVAAGLAFVAIWPVVHAVHRLTVPVGALLVVAPLLGYPVTATVVSVLSGLAIIGLASVGGSPGGDFGGGWQALWSSRRSTRLRG